MRNDAHDDRVGAALAEDVHTKTSNSGQTVGKVGGPFLLELSGHKFILSNQIDGYPARRIRQQLAHSGDIHFLELTV